MYALRLKVTGNDALHSIVKTKEQTELRRVMTTGISAPADNWHSWFRSAIDDLGSIRS